MTGYEMKAIDRDKSKWEMKYVLNIMTQIMFMDYTNINITY